MTVKKSPSEKLGAEFWVQPKDFLTDESVALIYANVASALREECESRDGDPLDFMLAERVAALYGHIRQRETSTGFAHDRARKETIQLWSQMATQLKKIWADADRDRLSEIMKRKVTAAMAATLETIPYEQRMVIHDALISNLEAAGL